MAIFFNLASALVKQNGVSLTSEYFSAGPSMKHCEAIRLFSTGYRISSPAYGRSINYPSMKRYAQNKRQVFHDVVTDNESRVLKPLFSVC
jgi:hypothetical protein